MIRVREALLQRADELHLGGLGLYPPMERDPHTKRPRPRARLHVDQRPRLPGHPVTTWNG